MKHRWQLTRACLYTILWTIVFGAHASANPSSPQHIASLNLCTDQVLLMLLPPQRIASVTYLAADRAYSYMWRQAQDLPHNSGLAEQLVPLQPDLVIAASSSPGSAVHLMKDLGFRVATVTIPSNLQEVESFVTRLGELVGEPQRAAAINSAMREKIQQAQQLRHRGSAPLSALVYAPNGHTAGRHTLKNDILQHAGFANLAADLGIDHYGNLSVEQVLMAQPDVVIIDDSTQNQNSLAQRYTTHPALQRALESSHRLAIDSNLWLCAGPMAADAVLQLARLAP